ncbi:MAG: adenylyltransferase/cytidyltransferase family protein, partial [Phycisphaerales bacterium]|nr:adenylyltransferase/cytidyltransferase family protein [Phycisphaerales bacterium]
MTAGRNKVVSGPEAATLTREAQARGEVVVHCHGCFDIVHPGHVRHLQQAAKLGDRLVVTVTGDALMGKGSDRPLIPEELRAENLAALDCVSWVAVSPHATARELLLALRPDVYVKGREYQHNHDPRFEEEKVAVESYGGRVVFTSGDVVFSSTALVAALEASEDPVRIALEPLIRHHRLDPEGLDGIVAEFRGRRVLVVGETIIDTYVICDQPVVAGEGPLMTLRPLEYRSFDGGAAIIARHLAALGARPTLLTPLPADSRADALRLRLEVEGVEVHSPQIDGPLIEKQRYMVGTNKVMKVDLAPPMTLDARDQQRAIDQARALAAGSEAMIVADFGLGFLTGPMLDTLCGTVRNVVDFMAGDVSGHRSNLLSMRDMDLLCPSEAEIRGALHDYEEGLSAVVWRLLEQTRSRSALVTLGHE